MGNDYTNDQLNVIYYTNVVCSVFSIMGSVFIFVLFLTIPSLRQLPYRLIFYLTISDFGMSIGLIIPYMLNTTLCKLQGYLISYFALSSIIWCALISHAMGSVIKFQAKLLPFEKYYLSIGFLLPLASFTVLFDVDEYKLALGWCWIYQNINVDSQYYRQIFYRMITYYIPLLLVLIYICYQYIGISRALKKLDLDSTIGEELVQKILTKMKIYPVILIFLQLPLIVIRFISFSVTPHYSGMAVAGAALSLNGFANAIAYGFTQEVKKVLAKAFCRKDIEMMSESQFFRS